MAMQGIDISGHQSDIDLSKVPCDFVIVKATQGTGYVSESCDSQVQQAISLGKLWGFYHYVGGGDANGEAEFFVNNTSNYFGHGIPCIDWEEFQNSAWGDLDYLSTLVKRVIELTGVKPIIYASESGFPWDVASSLDCGTWVAQYADNSQTGYQDSPWNEGAYGCAIRQYSSHGRLSGWDGDLDLDKAYIDADAWAKYAAGSSDAKATEQEPAAPEAPRYTNEQLADQVISGQWGDNPERAQKLSAAGYDPQAVQDIVNAKLGASSQQTYTVQSGDTLSGIASAYGTSWQRLAEINGLGNPDMIYPGQVLVVDDSAPAPAPAQQTYTVQSGDTLSGIAAAYGTSWQRLAEINGLGNPDVIYPGQVLTIG